MVGILLEVLDTCQVFMYYRKMSHAQRQIISRIPQQGMTGEEWGRVIENELVQIWTASVGATDRDALARDEHGRINLDKIPPALFVKLDSIILDQAQTLGWRIELSKIVQFRKSVWDHDPKGPKMHEKFGLACARSARIMQRLELPPIKDPDQWLVKKETVDELRLVLERLRAAFALRHGTPGPSETHRLFSETVSGSPDSFPHLAANLPRWQAFFEKNSSSLRPLITADRPKPAGLYDNFLSWCTGWDAESLRQAISHLGNAKL